MTHNDLPAPISWVNKLGSESVRCGSDSNLVKLRLIRINPWQPHRLSLVGPWFLKDSATWKTIDRHHDHQSLSRHGMCTIPKVNWCKPNNYICNAFTDTTVVANWSIIYHIGAPLLKKKNISQPKIHLECHTVHYSNLFPATITKKWGQYIIFVS